MYLPDQEDDGIVDGGLWPDAEMFLKFRWRREGRIDVQEPSQSLLVDAVENLRSRWRHKGQVIEDLVFGLSHGGHHDQLALFFPVDSSMR